MSTSDTLATNETDRLDPGWRLEQLEAKRAVVSDVQNSAPVVFLRVKRTAQACSSGKSPTADSRRNAKILLLRLKVPCALELNDLACKALTRG